MEPMRVSVLDSAALAEDVRTLEVIETLGVLPILESGQRKRNFYGVCGGNKSDP